MAQQKKKTTKDWRDELQQYEAALTNARNRSSAAPSSSSASSPSSASRDQQAMQYMTSLMDYAKKIDPKSPTVMKAWVPDSRTNPQQPDANRWRAQVNFYRNVLEQAKDRKSYMQTMAPMKATTKINETPVEASDDQQKKQKPMSYTEWRDYLRDAVANPNKYFSGSDFWENVQKAKQLNYDESAEGIRAKKNEYDRQRDEAANDLIFAAEMSLPPRAIKSFEYNLDNVDDLVAFLQRTNDGRNVIDSIQDETKRKNLQKYLDQYQTARARSAQLDEDLLYASTYESTDKLKSEAMANQDFAEKSGEAVAQKDTKALLGFMYSAQDTVYRFLADRDQRNAERDSILSNPEIGPTVLASGEDPLAPEDRQDYITDEDVQVIRYLYNTGDYQAALRYMDEAQRAANLRYTEAAREGVNNAVEDSAFAEWAQNRVRSLEKAALMPFQSEAAKKDPAAVFGPLFEPNALQSASEAAIRKQIEASVSATDNGQKFDEGIGKKIGMTSGQLASFLYGAGNSIVDNLIRDIPAQVTGIKGFQDVALMIMGSEAASDVLYNDITRGMSYYDAIEHAAQRGVTEYLTEKIGGEAAFAFLPENKYLTYIAKSGLSESAEEAMGGVADMLYDRYKNNPHSEHIQNTLAKYDASRSQNEAVKAFGVTGKEPISWSQAEQQATIDEYKEIAEEAASAFLSVVPSGTFHYAIGSIQGKTYNRILKSMAQNNVLNDQIEAQKKTIANLNEDLKKASSDTDKQAIQKQLNEETARLQQMEEQFANRGKKIEKDVKKLKDMIKKNGGNVSEDQEPTQASPVQRGDLGNGKTIQSIDKDGNIMVSDGTTMKASEVDWESMPVTKELYDLSMDLKTNYGVAPSMTFAAYSDGQSIGDYESAVGAIVSGAWGNTSLSEITESNDDVKAIDSAMAQNIYDAAKAMGEQDIQRRVAENQGRAKLIAGSGSVTITKDAQAVLDSMPTDSATRKSVEMLSDVFKAAGIKATFFASEAGEDGRFVGERGSVNDEATAVRIDVNSGHDMTGDTLLESAVAQVGAHELTHAIATRNPEGYKQLLKAVSDSLTKQGMSLYDFARQNKADYKASGKDIDQSVAMEEAVAQGFERVLKDSNFAETVAKKNPSLARQIADWFKDFAKKLKDIFKKKEYLTATSRAMENYVNQYAKVWDDALAAISATDAEQSQLVPNTNELEKTDNAVQTAERAETRRDGGLRPAQFTATGSDTIVYTSDNRQIDAHWALIDSDKLIASNLYTSMFQNPAYPDQLQPRDRSRSVSREQVEGIAHNLNPARLMDSAEASAGAPIVGPDGVVESGNGRTIAIQLALSEKGENAQRYTEALKERAESFGLNPDDVTDTSVLVRVRDTEMSMAERAEFAKEANVSTTARYAASETAGNDAGKISARTLNEYNPDGTQGSNKGFYMHFLQDAVPQTERNDLLNRDGEPTPRLVDRANNALFQRAYDDSNLTAKWTEALEPEAKNAMKAMMSVAAKVAQVKDGIAAGTRHDIDFSGDMARAAQEYIRIKKTGEKVEEWLPQTTLFEPGDTSRAIVQMMDEHKGSAKKLTAIFDEMLDQVIELGDPHQTSLLDDKTPSKMEIIERAKERAEARRYSMRTERDASYLDAVQKGDMETAQRLVEEAAREAGYTIRAYHGTGRADRVGNVFRPERSTSGPMAFFTSDRTIAENYARDKADTSIAYDSNYDSYEHQFRVTDKTGKSVAIPEVWSSLPYTVRQKITEAAGHVTFDDDAEEIIFDRNVRHGSGGFVQNLRESNGNALQALVEEWLNSGNLWDREGDFLNVLKVGGIDKILASRGYSAPEYFDPNARHERVYDTYLKVQNPFVTSEMYTSKFVEGLEAWWAKQDQRSYDRETANADMWDKNSMSMEKWIEKAKEDVSDGTTRAWTVVPDAVTDYLKSLGHDGIQDMGGKNGGAGHIVYIPFTGEQVKDASPVTYDDSGNVIPLSERFNPQNPDIRHSLRTDREMTDREVLGEAMKEIAPAAGDAEYLTKYQDAYRAMQSAQRGLAQQQKIMQGAEQNSNEYREANNRADVFQKRLADAEAKLDKLEKSGTFAKLVKLERRRAEKAAEELAKRDREIGRLEGARNRLEQQLANSRQRLVDYRRARNESADRSRYIERITDTVKDLSTLLATNSDKKHVPEALKRPLRDFLETLNLYSKRSNEGGPETKKDMKLSQYLNRVRDAIQGELLGDDSSLYIPQDIANMLASVQRSIESLESRYQDADPIVFMDNANLKELDTALRALKKAIGDVNRMFYENQFKTVSDASNTMYDELMRMKQANGKVDSSSIRQHLDKGLITPVYFFDRLGKAGTPLFDSLRRGYSKFAQRMGQVEDFAMKTWNAKDAAKWKKTVRDFNFKHDDGSTVAIKFTEAQIMTLYMYNKRSAAMRHVDNGGGVKAANIKDGNKDVVRQIEAAQLTRDDIRQIVAVLTPEQRAICDAVSKFMKMLGDWGNEVSMARFGYRAFGEDNYFPIYTSDKERNAMPERGEHGSDLYKLLNMSFTKSLDEKASNSLLIDDFFNIFANHAADMAKYSTMALPVLDTIRVLNYRDKKTGVNTRNAMEHAYGMNAERYLINFISDLSSATRVDERMPALNFIRNAKVAGVAGNVSVVLKQGLSIARAGIVLPELYSNPARMIREKEIFGYKKHKAEMLEHSGIALWKSMNYYDMDTGRPLEQRIAGGQTGLKGIHEWIVDKSGVGAEVADTLTLLRMWDVCKKRVNKTQPGLQKGSQEYWDAVNEIFENAVYRTQVVDGIMNRSDVMRSKNTRDKLLTAFMAEPILTYNTFADSVNKMRMEKQINGKISGKTAGLFARAFTAYALNGIGEALISALMKAVRDDDDYTSFLEKFKVALIGKEGDTPWERITSSALVDGLNPLGWIPLAQQVIKALKGESSGLETVGLEYVVKVANEGKKWAEWEFSDEKDPSKMPSVANTVNTFVRAMSYISGSPMYNILRDAKGLWNSTIGEDNPALKIQIKNPSASSGYSALYDAILAGNESEMARLEEAIKRHDAWDKVDSKTGKVTEGGKVEEKIREYVKADYLGGGMDYDTAEKILIEHGGADKVGDQSGYHYLHKWAYEKANKTETYSKYTPVDLALKTDDSKALAEAKTILKTHYGMKDKDIESNVATRIGNLLNAGDITESQAKSLYDKYTDKSALDIDKALDKARYQADNPDADMAEEYSYYMGLYPLIDQGKDISAEVKKSYGSSSQDQINSAVRSYIKAQYFGGASGYSRANVEKKLVQYGLADDANDAYWTMESWDYSNSHNGETYHYIDELVTALDKGTNIATVVKRYTSHGKKADSISSQLTSHYKPLWQAGNANTRAAIQQKMVRAWEALGYTKKQIQTKLENLQKNWAK